MSKAIYPQAFLVLVFLVSAFTSGCEITGPDDPRTTHDSDYEEEWANFQSGTYYFRVVRGCFCVNGGEHWVQVENGLVTSAFNIWRDEPVPAEQLEYLETIENMFEMIRRAKTEAFSLEVEYAKEGYPTFVSIDWIEFAVDDEISFTISDVHPGIR